MIKGAQPEHRWFDTYNTQVVGNDILLLRGRKYVMNVYIVCVRI